MMMMMAVFGDLPMKVGGTKVSRSRGMGDSAVAAADSVGRALHTALSAAGNAGDELLQPDE